MIQSWRHESVYQCRYIFSLPFCSNRIMKKTPWCIAATYTEWQITELQDGWGWKGLLEFIFSPHSCSSRATQLPRADFCIISRMDILQLPWAIYFRLITLTINRNVSWCSDDPSSVSFCVHSPWSCHWALKTAWLCLLCILPQLFSHISRMPLNLLFSRLNSPSPFSLSW